MARQSTLPATGDEVTVYYGRSYEDGDVERWYATGTVVDINDGRITLQHNDGSFTVAELYFCRIEPAYVYA
jgi:hypothetical protein